MDAGDLFRFALPCNQSGFFCRKILAGTRNCKSGDSSIELRLFEERFSSLVVDFENTRVAQKTKSYAHNVSTILPLYLSLGSWLCMDMCVHVSSS
jgi:hypothetical protein